jgi:hypothetical protein
MPLRAKQPEPQSRRLKLFMYGEAGVGKTTAACQMPKPYIIDSERGTDNYSDLINGVGGAVLQTTDIDDVVDEVRLLSVEPHDYLTLVVDPITPLYFDLVDKCEAKVGSDWGRHYGEANKTMKRLVNLLMRLDMNVVITAHAKPVYGDEQKRIGITFDAWKRLDYIFDLVLELRRNSPTKRVATVVKTRIETFPDGDRFDWGYEVLAERYDPKEMERAAEALEVSSGEQCQALADLAKRMVDGEDFIGKCLRKAGVDTLTDLTSEQADFMIEHIRKTLGAS